tara:strand:- start:55436 stop:55780 length:345 start_codon:yes stop_codon:yes gene_type:complete
MEKDYSKEERYLKAKKRVKEIQGFYWHLAVYIVINSFITVNIVIRNVYENGETMQEAFLDFGLFFVWVSWGIGLAIHAFVVFGSFPFLFGKNWEARKIKELIEKEEEHYKSLQK